jgi:farnesyl diphosphate synthase
MHARKTGALIRASACAGALMAGGARGMVDALDRWAASVGLAFQIVDDILDVEGASADLGKTAGKDAVAGKPTYPAVYGLDASKRLAAEAIRRADADLQDAGLHQSHLQAIAQWIVGRRS